MEIDKQIELIKRGSSDFIGEEELRKKLRTGKPLIIKWGADPSAPDLHLGHMVVLKKLRLFQDLGHKVVFIIGDFTGMIGDPSGKSETRKPLSKEEVKKNAKTYQDQVFKVLDKRKTEVVFNSKWLSKMDLASVMKLMGQYTVARMLERGDFKERFRQNREISVVEFLYPLLQGYDSVETGSDVELGGHDQIFNILVGRELQKAYGKDQQAVLTMPLLEGTDGSMKMSKSLGNYIGFTEPAKDIFGKTMSIPDELMVKYYELLTGLSNKELADITEGLKTGSLHPKEAKVLLGKILVEYFYGKDEAEKAEKEFDLVFKNKRLPENIPLKTFDVNEKVPITKLLVMSGLVDSTSEAKRKIEEGGVKINEQKITDKNMSFDLKDEITISVGKRKHARVKCV